MPSEPIRVSRDDLYEEIWAEPVIKVAQGYGITGTALSKICRKAGIPVPPVGYWQRLRHGYKPARPPLPAREAGVGALIKIGQRPPRPERSPEVEADLKREDDEKNRIQVADRLTRPHPLVSATAEVLRSRRTDKTKSMLMRFRRDKCLNVRTSRDNLPRALRIMDALLKALEERGFKISVTEGEGAGTHVELVGEKVEIALEERTKREDHVLTKDERERKAKYGSVWAPRWDYEPSGVLQLRIKEYAGHGARKTWSDGHTRRLEEALNDVVVGIIVVAEAKKQQRLDLERQRQEWAEAERRRLELEQRLRQEAEELRALEQEATSWARSQQLRAYLDLIEQEATKHGRSIEPGTQLRGWLDWARTHAEQLDPLRTRLGPCLRGE